MRRTAEPILGALGLSLTAWLLLVSMGHVAIVVVGGWAWSEPALWMVVLGLAGLAGSLAMAWIVWRLARGREQHGQVASQVQHQEQELEVGRSRLRASEVRLREVIDAVPAGVAIYDNQDRLLIFNQEVSHQYPYRSDAEVVGQTFEALMRRALAQGRIPEAVGREEEWLALRMAGRGVSQTPSLRHADDGQWVHSYEIRTPSGYLVATRLDMTSMVEKGLALERANEQLLRLSTTDGLTGIANRRLFDQTLQTEWQRCARNRSHLALLMIDIDHFKQYNDNYGHQTGDECLRQVARILAMCAKRSGELVARYGGEEFAILLPATDAAEAMVIGQRCVQEIASARIPHADSPVSPCLSVSVGVASMIAAPAEGRATLVMQADSAMYCAKKAGRARAESYDPEMVNALATRPAPL
ncbi:MAG: diguanylate cyclase [Burkholderiaceae bacterium]